MVRGREGYADTIEAPYLRITPGHYANIGEKDTLFKEREPPKTIPYTAARTYIAHRGECLPPGVIAEQLVFFSNQVEVIEHPQL